MPDVRDAGADPRGLAALLDVLREVRNAELQDLSHVLRRMLPEIALIRTNRPAAGASGEMAQARSKSRSSEGTSAVMETETSS